MKCGCLTLKNTDCQKSVTKGATTCSVHKGNKCTRKKSSSKKHKHTFKKHTSKKHTSKKHTSKKHTQKKESSPKKTLKSFRATLSQVLSIYTYPFLDERVRKFVQSRQQDMFDLMDQKLRLVYLENPEKTKQHYQYRHPIHIGGPSYGSIDTSAMKKVLRFSKSDIDSKNFDDPLLRYAIVAPIFVLDNPLGRHHWVIHTWGVNLESNHTLDGRYVFGEGKFSSTRYNHLLERMFQVIASSCDYIFSQYSSNQKIVLRLTKLGFGAWSSAIPADHKAKLLTRYEEHALHLNKKKWLQVRMPDYPHHKTYSGKTLVERDHDPFGPPQLEESKYMIEPYPQNAVVVFVNAWDDRSFIGNGGSRDNTLDGWMVSGGSSHFSKSEFGKPMGYHFANTSYLHNAFFQKNIKMIKA
jgi:hypothetical protein